MNTLAYILWLWFLGHVCSCQNQDQNMHISGKGTIQKYESKEPTIKKCSPFTNSALLRLPGREWSRVCMKTEYTFRCTTIGPFSFSCRTGILPIFMQLYNEHKWTRPFCKTNTKSCSHFSLNTFNGLNGIERKFLSCSWPFKMNTVLHKSIFIRWRYFYCPRWNVERTGARTGTRYIVLLTPRG